MLGGYPVLFRHPDERFDRALLRRTDEFGFPEIDVARPPGRFWPEEAPDLVLQNVDSARVAEVPSPATLLQRPPAGESLQTLTRRSIARLNAWFLVLEDKQRRLDRQAVVALAHQASLVRHCLDEPSLRRVLIADEVGLGKTVEAGLIVKELLKNAPGLRILYLAPARLVRNVYREFVRLGLAFRVWSADRELSTATLEDDRVIASIHRAAHENHFKAFTASAKGWDVIIVDECHHLSDWKEGGGGAVQKYKLVSKLVDGLGTEGRLILLSGTPHQGHAARFKNLLTLLQAPSEKPADLAGRVIYRTKSDVQDWDGRPLFPGRHVNKPVELRLDREYRDWLTGIHKLFEPNREGRAAGWRAGMALQWATSSVQAGLGFLVRQGIRAGLSHDMTAMRTAVEALRPYRGGPSDERVASVFARMAKEVERQQSAADIEDIEEWDDGTWKPNRGLLGDLLDVGVTLAERQGNRKWDILCAEILDKAPDEKFVLFAQPIETVTALARYLEQRYRIRPALIIGDQSESVRDEEIQGFRERPDARFLVSSRAGGEGLNLQVASRLIHVDVPWNPMELEQRVGRVHRFGSRRTIVVDTLVVADSRETDAYRIAHDKLREIASTLVPENRFEELFARVMSLVPPEELQSVLAQGPLAPLPADDRESVMKLVTEGFERWQDFDNKFKDQRKRIRDLEIGAATWADVAEFLERYADGRREEGFEALRFRLQGEEIVEDSARATVLALKEQLVALGETDGMPVRGTGGRLAEAVGLNSPCVVQILRSAGLPNATCGPAVVGLSPASKEALGTLSLPERFGILASAKQLLASSRGFSELGGSSLEVFLVELGKEPRALLAEEKRSLLRALAVATVRKELKNEDRPVVEELVQREAAIWQALRRPPPPTASERVLHAVTPLLAAVCTSD